jgi:cell division protein FtsW
MALRLRRRRPRTQQPLEHRLPPHRHVLPAGGGAVMVYSASSARTMLEGQGNGTMYLVKYVAYGAVGLS